MSVLKNAKHERFAQEIVKGKTATEAYVIVGYKHNDGNASKLASKVQGRVKEITERGAARAEVSVERIVQELARIGLADVTDVVSFTKGKVTLKNSADLPREITAAIAEVRQTKDGVQLKFHDKNTALRSLAQHVGLFKENVNLTVNVTLADLVMASYPTSSEESGK